MATATKPISFKKQVFNQLKDEVSIVTPIIGFNDEGHLTGLALTRKELVNLMNNKDTKGVIATDTTFGAVGFHLKSKQSSSDALLVPNQKEVSNLIDFTHDESFAFITRLEQSISKIDPKVIASVQGEVHTLDFEVSNVTFSITADQIRITTKNGNIIVHGQGRDLTLEEVASYLHETFNLSHQDFINMLKQAYGI
ncbi:hypothetical protein [Bacillus toyonensis]|uniref:hypothetical protein n=1 Tax=Bacillus toyonensis TaxID=155322 RepID=UPI000BF4F3A3|nr:hypothetical protein [Bacillus toyonensis]PGF05149.1 hypothetical protein COM61_01625 [Bacillus toyonensis]